MGKNAFGTIIQIGDILVSEEVVTEFFACDYGACRGACCIEGDSGAPLDERETETLERENTWRVQTPQVLKADIYRAASYTCAKEHFAATDDCALCEHVGFPVHLVDCGPMNIKITYPEDLIIAEAILASREKKENKA